MAEDISEIMNERVMVFIPIDNINIEVKPVTIEMGAIVWDIDVAGKAEVDIYVIENTS